MTKVQWWAHKVGPVHKPIYIERLAKVSTLGREFDLPCGHKQAKRPRTGYIDGVDCSECGTHYSYTETAGILSVWPEPEWEDPLSSLFG